MVPKEPPHSEDPHKTRAAKAAEAHVSSSTQAKAEWLRQAIRYAESWEVLDRLVEQIQAHFEAGRLTLAEAEDLARQIAREARRVAVDLSNIPASAFIGGDSR